MRVGVIGAGRQGSAAALDLAAQPDVEELRLADLDVDLARRVASRAPAGRITTTSLDARDPGGVAAFARDLNVVVSAASYRLHLSLMRVAIDCGAHFCDLGGNNTVVASQRAFDPEARAAGVTVVPDCGLAPGMASVLAAVGIERHHAPRAVRIRVGGIPKQPSPPLGYRLLFAPEGLINEYDEPCRVLRAGRIIEVEPLTEVETLEVPTIGRLEAFHTSGGASTLPESFADTLEELDYKTLRYPGHCERVRVLRDLGLMEAGPLTVDGVEVSPRRLLETVLAQRLADDGGDLVVVRVVVEGPPGPRGSRHVFQIVDHGDPARGLTAMMRLTAFPLAIVARMLGDGRIHGPGVVTQERAVPGAAFLDELETRGVRIHEAWEP